MYDLCALDRESKWDLRYLSVAATWAAWSKDPSTKVGAIIVNEEGDVIAEGYNGFPEGIPDDPAAYADREVKLRRTIHAEMNALIRARRSLRGHTLYTYPMMPCGSCTMHYIQAKIKRVVSITMPESLAPRWGGQWTESNKDFATAGVFVKHYPMELLRAYYEANRPRFDY